MAIFSYTKSSLNSKSYEGKSFQKHVLGFESRDEKIVNMAYFFISGVCASRMNWNKIRKFSRKIPWFEVKFHFTLKYLKT